MGSLVQVERKNQSSFSFFFFFFFFLRNMLGLISLDHISLFASGSSPVNARPNDPQFPNPAGLKCW